LNALELELKDLPDGFHERGLAQTRQALEQDVSLAQNPNQDHPVQFRTSQQNSVELFECSLRQVCRGLQFFRLEDRFKFAAHNDIGLTVKKSECYEKTLPAAKCGMGRRTERGRTGEMLL